jgi:hypothetical protein
MPGDRKCDRCHASVELHEIKEGTVNLTTHDQVRTMAFWCETCQGVLCAHCSGINPGGDMLFVAGSCPACKTDVAPATVQQYQREPAAALRRPWWKFWA